MRGFVQWARSLLTDRQGVPQTTAILKERSVDARETLVGASFCRGIVKILFTSVLIVAYDGEA